MADSDKLRQELSKRLHEKYGAECLYPRYTLPEIAELAYQEAKVLLQEEKNGRFG